MGYRLKGPKVEWKKSVNMLSDAVPTGAIQIPESGDPIIIMRDGQTTGGYPKIAVATSCAITRLGQVKPGDELKFSRVSLQDAQRELREYRRNLNQIESKLLEASL